jgi:hypothetical protein
MEAKLFKKVHIPPLTRTGRVLRGRAVSAGDTLRGFNHSHSHRLANGGAG